MGAWQFVRPAARGTDRRYGAAALHRPRAQLEPVRRISRVAPVESEGARRAGVRSRVAMRRERIAWFCPSESLRATTMIEHRRSGAWRVGRRGARRALAEEGGRPRRNRRADCRARDREDRSRGQRRARRRHRQHQAQGRRRREDRRGARPSWTSPRRAPRGEATPATARPRRRGARGRARPPPAAPAAGTPPADDKRATPAARRTAREHDVDLGAVQGSGAAGRVTNQDVEQRTHACCQRRPRSRRTAPRRRTPRGTVSA